VGGCQEKNSKPVCHPAVAMPAVVRHHGFCQGWHIVIQHLKHFKAVARLERKGTFDPKTPRQTLETKWGILWVVFSPILSNISPLNGSSILPQTFISFLPHLWAQQASTLGGPHVHWQLL